jgi:two-component system, NtrC family, response regulator AtoC
LPQSKVLIVDDEETLRFTLSEVMHKEGYTVVTATDGEDALQKMSETLFDLIILDIKMPKMDGMETLPRIKEIDSDATVIMITAFGSKELALQAIHIGAYDYFTKPFDIEEMRVVVRRGLEKNRLHRELSVLQKRPYEFENMIGQSNQMQDIFRLIHQVANSDATVLICGESGTGKELVAQAIHYHSPRTKKPFIKMNCVAIPEGLLESELFGHEKGSFTGALNQRVGKFELAQDGTLLLDEIGDMSLTTQAKLLRVLQEREFERVGGNKVVKVNIRIIAATNQDLAKAVQEKRFREDLYFRLNVVPIYLPPLRERKSDIPLLLDHFLRIYNARFSKQVRNVAPSVMKFFTEYSWPGNIREFENIIQRAVVLAQSDTLIENYLPLGTHPVKSNDIIPTESLSGNQPLSEKINAITTEAEKKIIIQALEEAQGNRTVAARILGLSRKGLYDKLARYNISDN